MISASIMNNGPKNPGIFISGNIGQDFRSLRNLDDVIAFCNHFELEDFQRFLSYSGESLGSKRTGYYGLRTEGGIFYIRSIYASQLKVLSGNGSSYGEDIKIKATAVIGEIRKNNFKDYSIKDAVLCCLISKN